MNQQEATLWVAGLFEGEGCIQVRENPFKIRVTVQMTDLDVLERIQGFFGGKIYKAKRQKSHHKMSWLWSLVNNPDATVFLTSIHPYLLSRRAKVADRALRRFAEWDEERRRQKEFIIQKHDRIRDLYATGSYTQRELAVQFRYCREHISRVVNKRCEIGT